MKYKTNTDIYFHQALHLLSSLPPFDKLKRRELQVFGELLKIHNEGTEVLLYAKNRDRVVKDLDISPALFRNVLTKLRKTNILVDNEINPKYVIKYLQKFNFEFYE